MISSQKLNNDIRDAGDFQISGKIIVIASDEFIRVFDATSAKQVEVSLNESKKYLIVHF